jgi:riboflavin kinase/FMN adenylyltransferase
VIYDDIPSDPLPGEGRVLGIGVFDGVHTGHQAVIRTVLEEANRLQIPSLLFTFDRLPEEVLRPEVAPKRLMDPYEKLGTLERLGPDEIVVAHVKPELLRLQHSEFVRGVLKDRFSPGVIVVGEDFRYGRGGQGNVQTLNADAEALGIRVITVPPVYSGAEKVSSTRIRNLLTEGMVEEAAE